MEKEFIHYEQALALKELGFDEPCFGFYVPLLNDTQELEIKLIETHGKKITLAPTFSQAFRWFREKYSICSWVYQVEENRYFFAQLKNGRYLVTKSSEYNTYEEAELECLKKLIEVKKK